MLLRREHLTAWKVNWDAKAMNLRTLGAELSLGLDSFVFIDDDAFECGAVRTLCPEVLVLQLPSDDAEIENYLLNIWDLDVKAATAEDQNRTLYYRQNANRIHAQTTASSLGEFLASLALEVNITPLAQEDVARAAQLMERTNQFNLNGIRRPALDFVRFLNAHERTCVTVRARDRFGDYGTVGLAIYFLDGSALNVEALLLSCRALGKGVEHRLFLHLAEAARVSGAEQICFAHVRTAKNQPLQAFLSGLGVSQDGNNWTISRERLRQKVSP
jgi:FkbH-like protein